MAAPQDNPSSQITTQDESIEHSIKDYATTFTKSRFGRKFLDILYETAVMFLYVGAIALLHKALKRWLDGAKLFNFLEVGYIIDAGHALAIGRFLLELLKNFLDGIKDVLRVFTKDKDNSGTTN